MNAELSLYVYRKRAAVEVAGDYGTTPAVHHGYRDNPRTIEESLPRESPDCLKRRYLGGRIPRSIAFWAAQFCRFAFLQEQTDYDGVCPADHIRFMRAKGVVVGVSNPNNHRRR
jgi:hypothetical protein